MMYVDCGYKEMWFKEMWFDTVEGKVDLPPGNLLSEVGQIISPNNNFIIHNMVTWKGKEWLLRAYNWTHSYMLCKFYNKPGTWILLSYFSDN